MTAPSQRTIQPGLARHGAVRAGVAISALLAVCGIAQAESRLALVIGNAAYLAPQRSLPHALNDARDIASALRKDGFQVVEIHNGARATMKAAVDEFSAKLKPGDVAVFYYAGHGVQGPARGNRSVNDDFLLPVNADIQTADSITQQGLSLSEVLSGLGNVKAGAELIILDACRDDPAAGPQGTAGLAWPVSAGARNAFIVFAASPGETAGDPPNGEHGVFTGEVLKRIGRPGLSAAALFTEVANAVEKVSDPTQRPYFAGTGAGAGLVLSEGPKSVDPSDVDLATYRQAMDCNKTQCLDYALPRVAEPRLRAALAERKAVLVRVSSAVAPPNAETRGEIAPHASGKPPPALASAKPAPTAAAMSRPSAPHAEVAQALPPSRKTAASPSRIAAPAQALHTRVLAAPLAPGAMPPEVLAFIHSHNDSAAGRLEIGRRFLNGRDGFPGSWKQAQIWLGSAADSGSGAAAYDLGVAFNQGLATKRNPTVAKVWFLRAAALGDGDGYVGAAGFISDQDQVRSTLEKGVALGSVDAMIALGEHLQEWEVLNTIIYKTRQAPKSMSYYRMAADRGDPNALAKIGECYVAGECGVAKDPVQAVHWFTLSADRGGDLGQLDLGTAYSSGRGVKKDMHKALALFEQAGFARRFGPVAVARILEQGLGGVAKDEQAAARWYRKAAELGDGYAALKLADFYDKRSWFNPAATAEAQHWRSQASMLGLPRFSPFSFVLESQFKKDGL